MRGGFNDSWLWLGKQRFFSSVIMVSLSELVKCFSGESIARMKNERSFVELWSVLLRKRWHHRNSLFWTWLDVCTIRWNRFRRLAGSSIIGLFAQRLEDFFRISQNLNKLQCNAIMCQCLHEQPRREQKPFQSVFKSILKENTTKSAAAWHSYSLN